MGWIQLKFKGNWSRSPQNYITSSNTFQQRGRLFRKSKGLGHQKLSWELRPLHPPPFVSTVLRVPSVFHLDPPLQQTRRREPRTGPFGWEDGDAFICKHRPANSGSCWKQMGSSKTTQTWQHIWSNSNSGDRYRGVLSLCCCHCLKRPHASSSFVMLIDI